MASNEMEEIPLSSDEGTGNECVPNHGHVGNKLQTEVSIDGDEVEEKSRLIQQVFSLQNTLDDLAQRVDAVKDENTKLKSENQILGQYIENLMAASNVFQGNKMSKNQNNRSKKDGKK